nr:PREDICTED: protein-glutamine gamma-glutamyltransferase 4 [Latimeria chalumnae]|eukprot:XP_005999060.1 PREDICTED: protein-glutamine gamma-glutamyltransferase 4 [Latimeria chalumnae]
MSWQAEDALRIEDVDFLQKKNGKHHHTDEFESPHLIVRRGQEFKMKLKLDREFRKKDKVYFHLALGQGKVQSSESLIVIELDSADSSQLWRATVCQAKGRKCVVQLSTPPDATVGEYHLWVKTDEQYTFSPDDNRIYILFNPWCQDDAVFMREGPERREYVLNDTGYIYVGSVQHISARSWNFGQFEEDVLDCCMYLLNKALPEAAERRDPVKVARKMSALVNSNDDWGILYGNWSGSYDDGTPPLTWTGSTAILQQYYKTRKPVKYGQCWVFSGVLTTVMRSLGIPARSVTNFVSAHDTEGNLKVDIYVDKNGEYLDDMITDSIWNFHVWNDVWMKRPDLPEGYDGWQALDSTPQEKSKGVFQCGPSPLPAIKSGEVHLEYDTRFVYAEVNADKIVWLVKHPSTAREKRIKLRKNAKAVGKHISTKAVGRNEREDITTQYKFHEGSRMERKNMKAACTEQPAVALPLVSTPVVQLGIRGDSSIPVGEPIALTITLTNTTSDSKAVSLTAACQLQTYAGKTVASIGNLKRDTEVGGDQCTEVPMKVEVDAYMKHLVSSKDDLLIHVSVVSKTGDGSEIDTEDATLIFQYPSIVAEMPATAKIGETVVCTFTFKNQLSIPLDNCKLHVEGLGLFKLETLNQGGIEPGRIFRSKIIFNPTKTGERKIVAKVSSVQINGIAVEKTITVTE